MTERKRLNIELHLGFSKSQSKIFIDGQQIREVVDFDVDLQSEFPTVMLKLFPSQMVIRGEQVQLFAYKRWPWFACELRWGFRDGLRSLLHGLRVAWHGLVEIWREAHWL